MAVMALAQRLFGPAPTTHGRHPCFRAMGSRTDPEWSATMKCCSKIRDAYPIAQAGVKPN
jgi:hypothetical protein